MRPQWNSVHDGWLSWWHQWWNVPYQSTLNSKKFFRLDLWIERIIHWPFWKLSCAHLVSLVKEDFCLIFTSLKLVQDRFSLWSDIQFWRIVNKEDDVSTINEPLTGVIEGEISRDLLSHFQNTRNLNNIYLNMSKEMKIIANMKSN